MMIVNNRTYFPLKVMTTSHPTNNWEQQQRAHRFCYKHRQCYRRHEIWPRNSRETATTHLTNDAFKTPALTIYTRVHLNKHGNHLYSGTNLSFIPWRYNARLTNSACTGCEILTANTCGIVSTVYSNSLYFSPTFIQCPWPCYSLLSPHPESMSVDMKCVLKANRLPAKQRGGVN